MRYNTDERATAAAVILNFFETEQPFLSEIGG